ncbi:kelch domain-containing protein 10-like [Stegodyphus dumicola]|uniref:kelch domain-containing protein 10-like n=1 Tax=Stegodyphus dumicola TaxID=202533 RepID=UPI0015AFD560|nr:kelch domain-containing protein 10-like [Stegodyphus dumicola]
MLVFGGTGVPFGESSSNSTHICNLDTLEWSTLQTTGSPPLEQYGQAMAVHQNKMYVVGGTTGYDYSMSVHCLDLNTKEWKLLEKNVINEMNFEPEPRYRHEIVIEGNQILVFGGGTGFECFGFKEVPAFNLDNYTWRSCPTSEEYPAARKCHGCVRLGNGMFDVFPFCVKQLLLNFQNYLMQKVIKCNGPLEVLCLKCTNPLICESLIL